MVPMRWSYRRVPQNVLETWGPIRAWATSVLGFHLGLPFVICYRDRNRVAIMSGSYPAGAASILSSTIVAPCGRPSVQVSDVTPHINAIAGFDVRGHLSHRWNGFQRQVCRMCVTDWYGSSDALEGRHVLPHMCRDPWRSCPYVGPLGECPHLSLMCAIVLRRK